MKKIFISIILLASVFIFSGCSSNSEPMVKKSTTGICHKKSTLFYNNTKNFTAYDSIDDCLKSGGRLPKK
jgi:PBP1b-binding outer membrane lipoprotein LpoB